MTYHDTPREPPFLSDQERAVLDFERSWWKSATSKDTAIRDALGHGPAQHYRVLNALIDRPEAMAHDPLLVRRLQRLRTERHDRRAARLRHPSSGAYVR